MLDAVQARLARVSPWMGLLDWIGGRSDDRLISFSLAASRRLAWRAALNLAALDPALAPTELDRLDRAVLALAQPIVNPGVRLGTILLIARLRESSDVAAVVEALS